LHQLYSNKVENNTEEDTKYIELMNKFSRLQKSLNYQIESIKESDEKLVKLDKRMEERKHLGDDYFQMVEILK